MNYKLQERKATQIRTNLKAAIAQLDSWNGVQANFRQQRDAANASSIGGHHQRRLEARNRAIISQGTQLIKDPPCNLCGSSNHLSDECDFIAVAASSQVAFEDPSVGVHRGIVHRVYSLASDLYRVHHPRFHPGPSVSTFSNTEAYLLPVPLVGPDYQEIGIAQAVTSLLDSASELNYLSVSFLRQRAIVDPVAQAYHSAAFPLDYSEFRDRIQELLSEQL